MKRFFVARLLAMLLTVSGCSFAPEKSPAPRLHDLGPLPSGAKGLPMPWSAVDVTAPEWLKDDRIRYRLMYSDSTRVGVYTLDRWVAPPSELLALRFGIFGDGGPLWVRIELQAFEQIFDQPDRAKAVMRFRASIYERMSKKRLAERTFELSRISPRPDAAGAVVSLAALADDAIAEVRTWIEGTDLVNGASAGLR
jgi:cholesterol transport system auxiliary component